MDLPYKDNLNYVRTLKLPPHLQEAAIKVIQDYAGTFQFREKLGAFLTESYKKEFKEDPDPSMIEGGVDMNLAQLYILDTFLAPEFEQSISYASRFSDEEKLELAAIDQSTTSWKEKETRFRIYLQNLANDIGLVHNLKVPAAVILLTTSFRAAMGIALVDNKSRN